MKEILLVADRLGIGGVERVVTNIAVGLPAAEFKVYLFLLEKADDHARARVNRPNLTVLDEYEERLAKTRKKKRILLFQMIKDCLKQHPDIQAVHVHCANQAPEVLLAARWRRVPVVCMHSHVSYSQYWNPKLFSAKERVLQPIFQWLYRTLATHKIGCSREACRSMYGKSKNQFFIPNGIDFEVFDAKRYGDRNELCEKYGLDAKNRYVVFVGRFCAQKNPLFLLEVFQKLRQKDESFQLLMIGYGEMEREIREAVERMGLSNDVRFFAPDSVVPEFFKLSECLLSPSICEGLGIVFVEAQLMGALAFASDQVPREADLGMCEFLALGGGAENYAEKMYERLSDGQSRRLDQKRAEQYDLRKTIEVYEKIYAGQV